MDQTADRQLTDVSRLTAALADRYTIERELGAGGVATVSLATDIKYHRNVAIKVLHDDLAASIGSDGWRDLRELKVARAGC